MDAASRLRLSRITLERYMQAALAGDIADQRGTMKLLMDEWLTIWPIIQAHPEIDVGDLVTLWQQAMLRVQLGRPDE
jgi:hypothetical protein